MTTIADPPGIRSIVVTQVYSDLGKGRGSRMAKFVVLFDGVVARGEIASIEVTGPGGYRFAVDASQAFDFRNLNGCLVDRVSGHLWYMAFDRRGFLPDGGYDIEVRSAAGAVRRRSRTLRYDDALLQFYLARAREIRRQPSGPVASGERITVSWSTLAALSGPDAYYCLRLSEGKSWPTADLGRLLFFDDIFEAANDRAGLNQDSATVPLPSGVRELTWFVELLDANRYEDINIAIFQPAVWCTVESGPGEFPR